MAPASPRWKQASVLRLKVFVEVDLVVIALLAGHDTSLLVVGDLFLQRRMHHERIMSAYSGEALQSRQGGESGA